MNLRIILLSFVVGCQAAELAHLERINAINKGNVLDENTHTVRSLEVSSWEFYQAVQSGNEELVKQVLKENGTDVNLETNGLTPLMRASQMGQKAMVEILLKYRANVGVTDILNRTALTYAAIYGHEGVMKLLVEYGAKINAQVLEWAVFAPSTTRASVMKYLEDFQNGRGSPRVTTEVASSSITTEVASSSITTEVASSSSTEETNAGATEENKAFASRGAWIALSCSAVISVVGGVLIYLYFIRHLYALNVENGVDEPNGGEQMEGEREDDGVEGEREDEQC